MVAILDGSPRPRSAGESAVSVAELQQAVEHRLARLSPRGARRPPPLTEAVRYALTAPGKRSRPVLALLCARYASA
jgi:geranylgeranyl pyrophosphate synthase